MNNDLKPALKLRKLMRNRESTLPGLNMHLLRACTKSWRENYESLLVSCNMDKLADRRNTFMPMPTLQNNFRGCAI